MKSFLPYLSAIFIIFFTLIAYKTLPEFGLKDISGNNESIVLAAGFIIAILIFCIVFLLTSASKKAEKVILEKTQEYQNIQDRLNLTIDAAKAAIFDWEVQTGKLYWSDLMLDKLGLDSDDLSYTDKDFFDRLHPEDKDKTWKNVKNHLEKKEIFSMEYRLRHKDGRYLWFEAKGQAIWDNGIPTRMAGMMVDVSDSIYLLNNLENIERLTNTGRWRVDLIEEKVIWSDQTYAIHGVPKEEEISLEQGIHFYSDEYKNLVRKYIDHAIKNGEDFKFYAQIISRDGYLKDVMSYGYCEKDDKGKTIALWGIFQDVTEQKKAQREMELMALIADNASDAMMIMTPDEAIEWVNPAFETLTKYDFSEIKGHNPWLKLAGRKTDLETVEIIKEKIKKGFYVKEEILLYNRDDHEIWVNIKINPVLNDNLALTKLVVIISQMAVPDEKIDPSYKPI
jgi:PAS domain S-box-containing protein